MPAELSVDSLLGSAKEAEIKFDWIEAAKAYYQLVNIESRSAQVQANSSLSEAETWEKLGFCYDRASQQSQTVEEFERGKRSAINAYGTAARLYSDEHDQTSKGRSAQCEAIAGYLSSWLAENPRERKDRMDKCHLFFKKSLDVFESANDEVNYGKTCIGLLFSLFDRINIAVDASEKAIVGEEGVEYAEKAISILSKSSDRNSLVLAYSAGSLLNWYAANISEQEEKRAELAKNALSYAEKAVALSAEADDPYSVPMSRWAATLCVLFFTEKIQTSMDYANEMLQLGSILRDNYIRGVALHLLAFVTDWMAPREVTSDKKRDKFEMIIKFAEKAICYLKLVRRDSIIAETYQFYAESCSSMAREVAISTNEKRSLLSKAVETGRKGLEHAIRSGSPDSLGSILHALSKAMHFYSDLEPKRELKSKLLEEALIHRKEYIRIVKITFPSNDWVLGVGKYYAGLIEAELGKLEPDRDKKITLFKSAVSDVEEGISHCNKWISTRPTPSLIVMVAEFEDRLGEILNEVYLLLENEKQLRKAIVVYANAAEKFRKADLPSRVAECCWKTGRTRDRLGDHHTATHDFRNASMSYKTAAEKIHPFADFYLDYAIYMEAWSEIEEAKSSRKNEDYGSAQDHFEKVANLLKQSKMWSYLASDFNAWALLEKAEDLSRKEKSTQSIEAFEEAAQLFEGARASIEETRMQRKETAGRDENVMVNELAEISYSRQEYCLGRAIVEEAKILDGQGNHAESSRKYGSALERFLKATQISGYDSVRTELMPIICLCRAWQTMTRAEAEASPDLYLEASELFEQAKQQVSNERARLLTLGHSRFCKALEAGTRFEETRDPKFHSVAVQHLEIAANYYTKAGFKTASDYAIATQRLFDGYIYMDNASKETDPEKKGKYYAIAERVMKASAEFYSAANHLEKAEQVQLILEKIREKREFTATLVEVMHAPNITSSTATFDTLTPNREEAVGLERFEHANIQGHLTVPEEVTMEEDFEIQLDLVNVAKTHGLLVRVDNLVPKDFKVTRVPSQYGLKDGSVELEGRRFEPLKVESIRLSAHASDFGIFKISPSLIYVDETGHFRKDNLAPVHVKVLAPKTRVLDAATKRKYEIIYKDLLAEHSKTPKNECRVAIAQIGMSTSGDIVTEFYEEKAPGIFGLRPEKVEVVRTKLRNMVEAAHAQQVDILLFPELTVDLNWPQLLEEVKNLAKTYQMYIVPGSTHIEQTRRNVSTVIGPDGVLWEQEKHVPAIIQHEGKKLREGINVGDMPRRTVVCNTEFGRIAITICRDFLDMDLRVELKNFKYPLDLVLNPAFTPVTADFKATHFDARRSIYAYCFFANVAEFGDSAIYTPEKDRTERMIPPKEENIIFKDVDLFGLRAERNKWEKEQKQFIQSTR